MSKEMTADQILNTFHVDKMVNSEPMYSRDTVIRAMEAYAQQKQPTQPMMTEDVIDSIVNRALSEENNHEGNAKAFRVAKRALMSIQPKTMSEEQVEQIVEVLETITCFPDDDLKEWINGTSPVTITIPCHLFKYAKNGIKALSGLTSTATTT